MHHTSIRQSIPEIARVLKPKGRASFCDPRLNCLYRAWGKISGGDYFGGEEEVGTLDYPIESTELTAIVQADFDRFEIYQSGGMLRYGMVFASRVFDLQLPLAVSAGLLRGERLVMNLLGLQSLQNFIALLLQR